LGVCRAALMKVALKNGEIEDEEDYRELDR
jgi:hypothetical protein